MERTWITALEVRILDPDKRLEIERFGTRARLFFLRNCFSGSDAHITLADISNMPEWAYWSPHKQAYLARLSGVASIIPDLKARPDGSLFRKVAKIIGVRALDNMFANPSLSNAACPRLPAWNEKTIAAKGYSTMRDSLGNKVAQARVNAAMAAMPLALDRENSP